MPKPLNILIVEDSPDDADLALRELRRAGFDPKWKRIETEPDFLAEIAKSPDIILSDYAMPQFSGLRAAELLRQSGRDIPFILISGTVGEDIAVEAMKQGVTDYLLKDRVARLGIAVERALEEKRLRDERNQMEDARRISDARYRTLFDYAPDGIVIANANGFYLDANASICRMLGYTRDELVGLHSSNIVAVTEIPNISPALTAINARQDYHREWQFRRKDGSLFDAEVIATAMPDGNLLGMIRDITERKQFEKELHIAHEKMRQLLKHSPAVIYTLKIDGEIITPVVVSENIERLLGFAANECNSYNWWVDHLHPQDRDRALATLKKALTQDGYSMEYRITHKDGTYRWVEDNNRLLRDANGRPSHMVGIWTDISERKYAEEVLRNVSRQSTSRKKNRIIWDLAIIFGLGILSYFFVYYTDMLAVPMDILVSKYKGHLDDLFVPPLILLLGLLIFSYRRLRDTRSQVDEQANIQETLRKLHDELEKRIQQRTLELANANDALRTEISERKRAQEQILLQSHSLEAAANAILITDCSGKIIFANSAFCTLTGYSREEVLGQNPRMLKSGTHDANFYHNLWETISAGRVWRGELVNRRKDGTLYNEEMTITPVLAADGKITHFIAVKQDTTERNRREEELRSRTAFFEAQANSALDGVLVVDSRKKIILQNLLLNEIFRLPQSVIDDPDDNHRLQQVTGQMKDPQQFIERVEWLYAHPQEVGFDEIELADGRILERYSAPVEDRMGKYYGRIWTFRDITQKRKLAEQLRQSQKMEAVGQLAGGVAHDFNNILAVIQMQSDLLKASEGSTSVHKEFADEIGAASARAAALTRQLLLFSRKQTMRLQDLDLNESINNMTKMLRRTIGEDIQMQFKFAMQSLHVRADPNMMDQVLMNLAVNARDAMPNGGKLVIETSAVEFDETAVAHSPKVRPGSFICLGVSDTGCGIPSENLQRIFEPFFTTKEVGKGTGLGLATVFGIIEQHRGWINVYSEVGRGTTFRIYLPLLASVSGEKPQPTTFASMPHGNETILLVEDDAFVRSTVRRTLVQLGYQVFEAVNGPDALDIWKQNHDKIHLVLTDMVMPGNMTGKDLGELLRKEKPDLKIIYASGYSAEMAEKGLSLEEGVDFLTKPFSSASLARIIRVRLDS